METSFTVDSLLFLERYQDACAASGPSQLQRAPHHGHEIDGVCNKNMNSGEADVSADGN
jgi:hypothetical protein